MSEISISKGVLPAKQDRITNQDTASDERKIHNPIDSVDILSTGNEDTGIYFPKFVSRQKEDQKKNVLPGTCIDWKNVNLDDVERKRLLSEIKGSFCCPSSDKNLPEEYRKSDLLKNTDEKWAVFQYTGGVYTEVINFLRFGKTGSHSPETLMAMCRLIASAINKLPEYNGTLYRGILRLPPEVLEKYVPGNTVTEHGFTSTTKSKKFAFTGPYADNCFVIKSKTAKDMSSLNTYMEEVLFLPETRFKILAREKQGNVDLIFMEEVDDQKPEN